MSEEQLPRFIKGGPMLAEDMNKVRDEVSRQSSFLGLSGSDASQTFDGPTGRVARGARVQPIWVKVTANGNGAHSWIEQERYIDDEDMLAWRDAGAGLRGDYDGANALRSAAGSILPIGTVVLAWRRGAYEDEWLCELAAGNDRWGILTEDLRGGTTEGVLANWKYFARNDADSGSLGQWASALDGNGDPAQFLVIAPLGDILPSTKKLPAGRAVHCEHVGEDVWAPDASGCTTAVDAEEEPEPPPQ